MPCVFAVFVESVIVAILNKVYHIPLFMDDRMITMMGSAIAMLLAFRTNRSFERYNLGAQLWTNFAIQVRTRINYGKIKINCNLDTSSISNYLEWCKSNFRRRSSRENTNHETPSC